MNEMITDEIGPQKSMAAVGSFKAISILKGLAIWQEKHLCRAAQSSSDPLKNRASIVIRKNKERRKDGLATLNY
jgi:hypothetical protein